MNVAIRLGLGWSKVNRDLDASHLGWSAIPKSDCFC